MKKTSCVLVVGIIIVVLILFAFAGAASANMKLFDFTWSFEYAQIAMPDSSVVEGPVDSWKDYEDSDCIQIEIDGKTYLTHYSRVVLVSD